MRGMKRRLENFLTVIRDYIHAIIITIILFLLLAYFVFRFGFFFIIILFLSFFTFISFPLYFTVLHRIYSSLFVFFIAFKALFIFTYFLHCIQYSYRHALCIGMRLWIWLYTRYLSLHKVTCECLMFYFRKVWKIIVFTYFSDFWKIFI